MQLQHKFIMEHNNIQGAAKK